VGTVLASGRERVMVGTVLVSGRESAVWFGVIVVSIAERETWTMSLSTSASELLLSE
jgi:hypothetical protein